MKADQGNFYCEKRCDCDTIEFWYLYRKFEFTARLNPPVSVWTLKETWLYERYTENPLFLARE